MENSEVMQIIDTIKNGEVLPYALIHRFLTLEDGDVQHNGILKNTGVLGMQFRKAEKDGIINKNFCARSILKKEEIHLKLLRILARFSEEPIKNAASSEEKEHILNNLFLNYTYILLCRDNTPMDENGNISKEYQGSLDSYTSFLKETYNNKPSLFQKDISEQCDPEDEIER